MNIDWTALDWLRIGTWLISSIAACIILVKVLRFIAGFIIGLIVTLIMGWLFYKGMLF